MPDFKSHLPVQTHKDGATFTPSSHYTVGVGGYESGAGTLLTAAVTANREWMVVDTNFATVVFNEDDASASGHSGISFLSVRQDTIASSTSADGDYQDIKSDSVGRIYTRDASVFSEDTAHVSGDFGCFILGVRNDAGTSLASADGDYAPFQLDSTGKLWTSTSLPDITKAEDSAHVSGDKGVMFLAVRNDTGAVLAGSDGDYIPVTTNNVGALRVTVVDPTESATEVNDYQTSSAVAVAGSVNHDYTVTALKTLKVKRVLASASGRIKAEVIIDPAGTPATKFVEFNSTANPNIRIPVDFLLEVAAGTVVRIQITNLDEDAQDVYSTLLGNEI